jgi:hypothetical protein
MLFLRIQHLIEIALDLGRFGAIVYERAGSDRARNAS